MVVGQRLEIDGPGQESGGGYSATVGKGWRWRPKWPNLSMALSCEPRHAQKSRN